MYNLILEKPVKENKSIHLCKNVHGEVLLWVGDTIIGNFTEGGTLHIYKNRIEEEGFRLIVYRRGIPLSL